MPESGKKGWKQDYYDTLMADREKIRSDRSEGWKAFDNFIITLASGAFGISLTFVVDRFKGIEVGYVWALGGAYFSFGSSITSTLYSYLTVHENLTKKVSAIDELADYLKKINSRRKIEAKRIGLKRKYRPSADLTLLLNKVSFWTFILGMVSLAIFVIYNINKVRGAACD
jgi:hypothetical protein